MRKFALRQRKVILFAVLSFLFLHSFTVTHAQTLAFPGATGFGRFAKGARGVATPTVYVVTNLYDSGPGSFREAVSTPGRIVVFAVGGIINLASDVVVAANVTIAGQTAPGDGIVLFNKRVTFTGANNTICRFLRIRLGAAGNSGKDASGLANGANMIFDHMSFSWGMDEVFSINWDNKGTAPDSITVQNSIIAQGLHRENHSAGGLIQTPDGGKVSLIRNLYISNKTRNPKVKGVNEFVNNVVYDWGNGNRLGDNLNYGWSADAYIMGGSAGVSEVNIINNYFMGGPLTPPNKTTPFSRGTGTFFLYGAGNYFDNNQNGIQDGALVPYDTLGYPGIAADGFKTQPFPYPQANPAFTAEQAYSWVIDSVGASYPRRDQVDSLLAEEVRSRGTKGYYVYRESDLPFTNGGVGTVFNAPAPLDSDSDGMPDSWEDAHGLNKNNTQDAVAYNITHSQYLNIEVYINTLLETPPATFIRPPSNVTLTASTFELPAPYCKIVVQWTDNASNEDHFVLERSANGVTYTDITHPATNATSYSDSTGLLPNSTYYYRLKAVNSSGASSYSAPVSVKTPPLPSAPSAATAPVPANGNQYVELAGGVTTLKWSGSSNTVTYAIWFGTDTSNLVKKAEIAYTPNASYSVTGLTDFVNYYWRIDAINAKGTTQGELWQFRTSKNFPAGLAGHWSFDETEGRQATDSSTYQDHGVLGLDDDNQNIRVTGKINNALDFSTASQDMYVVNVPHQDHLYLDKSSFSLSFWMKADLSLLPADNNTSAYLLCKGSITRNGTTGATGKRFDIEFKNKQLRFAIDDDNDANGGGKDELQADGTPFFTGNWVHVTTIRDTATKKLRLYMNGALVKETAIAKANAGIGEASDLIIGNIGELEFLSSANKPAPYKGMLDELKIYNYALSAEEVLGLYHTSPLPLQPYNPSLANGAMLEGYGDSVRINWKGGLKTNRYKLYSGTDSSNLSYVSDIALNAPTYTFTNLTAKTNYYWRVDAEGDAGTTTGATWWFRAVSPKGMSGHWKFDEASGTVVADNSNYHHNGNIVNMPQVTFTTGKFGNGLQYLNPVAASAVHVPHAEHLLFDANSFSISLWVKLTNGSSNYNSSGGKDCYLIHKGQFTDPGGKWYGIQLKDSILTFAIDDASTKTNLDISLKKASAFHIFNNNFSNIIVIKDTAAKQIRVYINGVQAGSKTYTTIGTIGKAVPLLIGNSLENKPFHDVMDDVRLYNYALSPAEIASLLNGNPLIAAVTDPQPANGDTTVPYGTINLGWKGKGQTYNVYAGTTPDSLEQLITRITTTSFALTDANRPGNYYWRVDAVRDGEAATGPTWWFRIIDTVPPVAITKNISVTLSNGTATITASDVNNGSWDTFGIQQMQVSPSTFNCTNIGGNEVQLSVIDSNNNSATAKAIVTVIGVIPAPAITVSRTNPVYTGGDANTIYLGYGAQQLKLTAANAMPAQYTWSPANALSDSTIANPLFTPTQAGEYTYTAKATNQYGCTATASVNLHVEDVRCGGRDQKVMACYHGFGLCVSKLAVPILLYLGAELGACETNNARIVADQPQAIIDAQQKFMVYPTPASNQCSIAFTLNKPGKYRVELYNTQGRLIKVVGQGETNTNQLLTYPMNTSQLSTGVYFIKLVTATDVQVKQLIIQR
ncbi:T9SS type A sorting domain-containing protein [Niastella caeni]|uniref:T9SS type A sorting domain-containing protein n=1 Tax=Niastella caeni TaxID=2569763 RepID=A0A4S8HZG3_9BACT|nr:LamG-like jellyroll fold domain-containing protein [Niastella caeni]THU41137.1 T9SS type A sorting domain-containing protein [Niastella caeni]